MEYICRGTIYYSCGGNIAFAKESTALLVLIFAASALHDCEGSWNLMGAHNWILVIAPKLQRAHCKQLFSLQDIYLVPQGTYY